MRPNLKSNLNHRNMSALAAAVSLAITALLAAPGLALAQDKGGSGNIGKHDGFGCASGTSYTMVGGIARCTLPAATGTPIASCAAAALTNGVCSFNFPATTSGSTPELASSTPGYVGIGQATCNMGAWSAVTGTCAPKGCSGASSNFGSCSYTIPALVDGQSLAVATGTAGFTGAETASCSLGTLTLGAQTCSPVAPPLPPASCAAGSHLE